MSSIQNQNYIEENDSVDIVKEIRYYLFFWPWFLLSLILFTTGTYLYLRYATAQRLLKSGEVAHSKLGGKIIIPTRPLRDKFGL